MGAIRTIAMLGTHVPRQCGIATFTTDLVPSDGPGPNVDFETFYFGPGWTNLVAIEFLVIPPDEDTRQMGYDNIVLNVEPVPEPSSVLLALIGVASLALCRRRIRRTAKVA